MTPVEAEVPAPHRIYGRFGRYNTPVTDTLPLTSNACPGAELPIPTDPVLK